VANATFADSRIVIYGAGAAGLGIQRQLRAQLARVGLDGEALTRAILVMDSQGIVSEDRAGLDDFKKEMAWPGAMTVELGLDATGRKDLQSVVTAYKATALVGTSGQGGSFTEATVRAMLAYSDVPIILPMSNPTSISEAVPADLMNWTNGKALVATGSPFAPVSTAQGVRRIGQANNVFVFPGIGLGTIVTGARELTSSMIAAAANALAESLTDEEIAAQQLVPNIGRLWEVCGEVALEVARQAVIDGVAADANVELLPARLNAYRWRPHYPEIVIAGEAG
jgi:malate dehydrogenase (oxaloacetate-decarboxylating)